MAPTTSLRWFNILKICPSPDNSCCKERCQCLNLHAAQKRLKVCGGGIYVYLGDSSGKRSWESEAPFWPFVFSLGQRTNLSVSQPVSRERTRRRSSIFWWIQEEISRERTADPEGWPQTRWSSRLVWTLMQQASCLSVGWEEFWSAELELSSSCNDQGFILEQPLLECLFSWLFMHDYNKMALKK